MSTRAVYEIHCNNFDIKHVGKVLKFDAYSKIKECRLLLKSAKIQCDNVLRTAEIKKSQIIEEAEQKAKKIIKETQESKKNEEERGYRDGLESGKQEISDAMMDFVVKSANSFQKLESDITEVVKTALRKIIGKIDKTELIVNVVKNSLKKIKLQKQATLRVAPSDAMLLRDRVAELTKDTPTLEFLDVSADNHLSAGACILETELGVIDASINVQLEAIENALAKFGTWQYGDGSGK